MQHVAGREIAPCVSAEAPEREGSAASQVSGLVDPTAEEHVGSQASPAHASEFESLPGRDRNRGVCRDGRSIHARIAVSACEADRRGAVKEKRRTQRCDFEPGCAFWVAEEPVAEPKRKTVHRARRWHANVPISSSSRVVLHRRRQATAQHANRTLGVRHAGQCAGRDVPGRKHVAADNLPQPVEIGFQSVDECGIESALQSCDRCRPVSALDD